MVLNASIVNEQFKSVENGDPTEALIEELLKTNHDRWESHLFLSEEIIQEDDDEEDWYPDHDITLSADPGAGYGAIRWVGIEEGVLVPYVTLNPESEPEVDLLHDGGTPFYFPRTAALPLDDIRKALLEFVSTGKRPECVRWQDFDKV